MSLSVMSLSKNVKRAFTLVELLVVIAIIGVLVALLLRISDRSGPATALATHPADTGGRKKQPPRPEAGRKKRPPRAEAGRGKSSASAEAEE